MDSDYSDKNPVLGALYTEHIETVAARHDHALEQAGASHVVIYSGNPKIAFLDDYHLPFKPNPHFVAWPAGSGVAAGWLARLGDHLDEERFRSAARKTLIGLQPAVERSASAFASLLLAADRELRPSLEIAIAGSPDAPETVALVGLLHAIR